ncbi:agrin-like [Gigantopelta aegis]|uniref:agrin-like n=1 Tax=Gigantopelta aegis TaxID=1735272 RepID=UPI001B88D1A8|nr:agrin-like [Gigantopelta aegis]
MKLVLYLAIIVGACGENLHNNKNLVCQLVIEQLDCSHYEAKTICANHEYEFDTECEFAKAHCRNQQLKITREGPCNIIYFTDTTKNPVVTTSAPKTCDNMLASTVCNDIKNELCGSDHKTYNNYCKFDKARCSMLPQVIHIVHHGPCKPDVASTTVAPSTALPSAYEIICRAISKVTCPTAPDELCGSDGHTYHTPCEFEKAKCQQNSLTVSKNGRC